MDDFRRRAERMLHRWGAEIDQGEGKPNILAMVDHVVGTSESPLPAGVGAMFSPLAEECDRMIHQLAMVDRRTVEYLIAYATGLSVTDMARSFGVNRNKVQIQLEASLSVFAYCVYYRAKDGRTV